MSQPSSSSSSIHEQLRQADFAHWKDLQTRISDFTTARLIVDFLDQHPSLKTQHLGVYLRACESVQRYRIRCAKRYRFGRTAGAVVKSIYLLFKAVGQGVFQLAVKGGAPSEKRPAPVEKATVLSANPAKPKESHALVWPTLFAPNDIESQAR